MNASSENKNISEKQVVLNLEMTVQQAIEMRLELIKCFEAFAYCHSYGQKDFNLAPVYLLPLLEGLEKQINAIEYKQTAILLVKTKNCRFFLQAV